jgi:hypothetical protein
VPERCSGGPFDHWANHPVVNRIGVPDEADLDWIDEQTA